MNPLLSNDSWKPLCCLAIVWLCLAVNTASAQTFVPEILPGVPALTDAQAQWADFNNDGHPDLFLSGQTTGGSLQTGVFLNSGGGTFSAIALTGVAGCAFDLADYDRDGYIDILLTGVGNDGTKIARIYKNTAGTGFTSPPFSLTPLARGGVVWRDLDNDGDLDIVMTGLDASNTPRTHVYAFNDGDYHLQTVNLPGVSNGAIDAFDANNDGALEVVITGLAANGVPLTRIWSVDQNLAFTTYASDLEGMAFNAMAIGDLDGNGFADLVMAGLAGEGLEVKTLVLRNTGLDFISTPTAMADVSSASVDLADLDNDGELDVVITGQDDSVPFAFKHAHIYRNDGAFSFTDAPHGMPGISSGDVALVDFEGDGDVDIFQIGGADVTVEAKLYRSGQSGNIINQPPGIPTSLEAVTKGSMVTLRWIAPTDDHTPSPELTYDLYVSHSPEGKDAIVLPLADLNSGNRRLARSGDVGMTTEKRFHSLPEGRYYWSVQAIDGGYRGSSFAPEQSLAICHEISLGEDLSVCYGQEIELEAGSTDDVVRWYSNKHGLLHTGSSLAHRILDDEVIIAEVTRPHGCTVKDTLAVAMISLPVVDLGPDTNICYGETFAVALTTSYDSVNWMNPRELLKKDASDFSFSVFGKDTLIAQIFNAERCVNYDSVIVDVLPLPAFSIGDDQEVCDQSDAEFSVSVPWNKLEWYTRDERYTSSDAAVFILPVSGPAEVIARLTDDAGCVNYDTARVNPLPLPEVALGPDRAVCLDETTQFEIPDADGPVNWYRTDGEPLATNVTTFGFVVRQDAAIVAEITGENSCVNRDTVTVKALPLPGVNIGADREVCIGDEVLLEAGSGLAQVDWFSKKDDSILKGESWFYQHPVSKTDTVIVRVRDHAGCINYDSVRIASLERPVFSLGVDLAVCPGETVGLSVEGTWKEVNWYSDHNILLERDNATLSLVVDDAMPIYAEVVHVNGCTHRDTLLVTTLPEPVFDLGPSQSYCAGDEVSLNAGADAVQFNWHDEGGALLGGDPVYTFPATSSVRIFLTATNAQGCTYRDSVDIVVHALPDFVIEGPGEACEEDEITLRVDRAWETITWYRNGDAMASDVSALSLFITDDVTVEVHLTDIHQCVGTGEIAIAMHERPVADAGPDVLICFGESATIGGTYADEGSLAFEWLPSDGLSDPLVARPVATPEASATYAVRITDENGCWSTDTVQIEVNPQVIVDAGPDVAICIGEHATLGGAPTASGSAFPYSYQWIGGDVSATTPSVVVSPKETTTYYVFVTTGKCAVEYDSVIVTVNALPEVTAVNTQAIGAGGATRLSASGAVSYVWSPAASLDDPGIATPLASPNITTTYAVTGIDENGCSASAEVVVIVQNTLFIPSLFTPNGDGHNDVFRLYGSGIDVLSFSVFDQHGNRIFHADDITTGFETGWDGTYNGQPLRNDIYFWTLEGRFSNGDPVQFEGKNRGIIKLMR